MKTTPLFRRQNHALSFLCLGLLIALAAPEGGSTAPALHPESHERVAEFERRFEYQILPHYRVLGVPASFEAEGFAGAPRFSTASGNPMGAEPSRPAVRIHSRVFRLTQFTESFPERGAVVISPDLGELELEYAETVFDLTTAGYSVFILEHRGSGLSERLLPDPRIAHVERFLDYSADLKQFVDEIVKPSTHPSLFLLCQGLGCTIAAPYLSANPSLFHAVVMSSPLLDFGGRASWLSWPARLAGWAEGLSLLPGSMSSDPAPGYDLDADEAEFELNRSTGSFMRYRKALEGVKKLERESELGRGSGPGRKRGRGHTLRGPALRRHGLQLKAPSNHWVAEALDAISDLEILQPWQSSTVILSSGHDTRPNLAAAQRLCARLNQRERRCARMHFPDAFPSLFRERDAIRDLALSEVHRQFQGTTGRLR